MTGSGIQADPFIIYNVVDLQAMQNNLSAWYELGNDIDASDTVNWNAGAGFAPIGVSPCFTGFLNGKDCRIINLFINRPGGPQGVGLIGSHNAWPGMSTINFVHMVNVNVTGSTRVGALAGFVSNGVIHNCSSSGSVTGSLAGGLVGSTWGSANIKHCYSSALVRGSGRVGGLVGETFTGISECYATGNILSTASGQLFFGGLIGIGFAPVTKCFATGDVLIPGGRAVGGLVGESQGSTLDSYARGAVLGFRDVGGLVGNIGHTIERCYSTGFVTGSFDVGGLVGTVTHPGANVNCFWDTQTSGQSLSAAGTGKTTAEMKTQSTYTGWDFVMVWRMLSAVNDGYPYLLRDIEGHIWIDSITLRYIDENTQIRTTTGALTGATALPSGYLWVEGTFLHYIDELGNERRKEGLL